MVTAFDLIQYFSVAALFGWLTFSRLTDSEIKRVPLRNRKIAKKNLILINQLFIMSFLFFAISAIADYFLHHLTISSGIATLLQPQRDFVLLAVAQTFLTGLGLLVAPIAYVHAVGRLGKHLGSFELASFWWTLGFMLIATAYSLFMWTAITFSTTLFYLLIASGFVPYVGLYFTLRYWKSKRGVIAGVVLIVWPLILVSIFWLLSRVMPRPA